jgi:hypothetical protein
VRTQPAPIAYHLLVECRPRRPLERLSRAFSSRKALASSSSRSLSARACLNNILNAARSCSSPSSGDLLMARANHRVALLGNRRKATPARDFAPLTLGSLWAHRSNWSEALKARLPAIALRDAYTRSRYTQCDNPGRVVSYECAAPVWQTNRSGRTSDYARPVFAFLGLPPSLPFLLAALAFALLVALPPPAPK